MGTEYVDLFLIHWPLPTLYDGDYVSTWKTLEEFRQDGRARSIGVSNFQPEHLVRLAAETDMMPAVNQIELHPYFGNNETDAYGRARRDRDPGVGADRAGQGARRPGAQRGSQGGLGKLTGTGRPPLAHPARQHRLPEVDHTRSDQGNFELFDFQLEPDVVAKIDALNRGEEGRDGPHPDRMAYVPQT